MTRDDIASAITPVVRAGLAAAAGFLASRGFAGASDLVSSFTAAGVTLIATVAWALVEKSKLLQIICSQVPLSSLEEVANTVSKLKGAGGDPLLIAHIAQAVTALANQELAAAQPQLVPPPAPASQPVVVAEVPPPPTEVAPAVAAASSEPAPVLADGSLPA